MRKLNRGRGEEERKEAKWKEKRGRENEYMAGDTGKRKL